MTTVLCIIALGRAFRKNDSAAVDQLIGQLETWLSPEDLIAILEALIDEPAAARTESLERDMRRPLVA